MSIVDKLAADWCRGQGWEDGDTVRTPQGSEVKIHHIAPDFVVIHDGWSLKTWVPVEDAGWAKDEPRLIWHVDPTPNMDAVKDWSVNTGERFEFSIDITCGFRPPPGFTKDGIDAILGRHAHEIAAELNNS